MDSFFTEVVLPIFFIAIAALAPATYFIYIVDLKSCHNRGQIMGVASEYRFFGGCFYEVKGQYINEKLLRIGDFVGSEDEGL